MALRGPAGRRPTRRGAAETDRGALLAGEHESGALIEWSSGANARAAPAPPLSVQPPTAPAAAAAPPAGFAYPPVVPREDLRYSKQRATLRLGDARARLYANHGEKAKGDGERAMHLCLPLSVWPLHRIAIPKTASVDDMLAYCTDASPLATRLEDLVRAGAGWERLLEMGLGARHMHTGSGGLLDHTYLANVLGVSLARLQRDLCLDRRWLFESGVAPGQLSVLASVCKAEEACALCRAGQPHTEEDPVCAEPTAASLLLHDFGLTTRDFFALRYTTDQWLLLLGLRADDLMPLQLSGAEFAQLRFSAAQWLDMGLTARHTEAMGVSGVVWRRLVASGHWKYGDLVEGLGYSYADLSRLGLGVQQHAGDQSACPVRDFSRFGHM
jgi:hypothetical protein